MWYKLLNRDTVLPRCGLRRRGVNVGRILWELRMPLGGLEESRLEEVVASIQMGEEVRVNLRGSLVTLRRDHDDAPFLCGLSGAPAIFYKIERESASIIAGLSGRALN